MATKRKDGRWVTAVTVGIDDDGNPIRKYAYGNSEKQANHKADELKKLASVVNYTEATLGEWLDEWLDVIIKDEIRITTWESYETICRLHLKPTLGSMKLNQIQPQHIRKLLSQKKSTGLSPRRLQYIYVIINAAFKQAIMDSLLIANPCAAVAKPKLKDGQDIKPIAKEDFDKVLTAAKESPYYALYSLAWATGMRIGEILGLRWCDCNFSTGTVSVNQTACKTRKGISISKPKTKHGYRTLPVPREVMKLLQEHKRYQNEYRLAYGFEYNSQYDLVFPKQDGSPRSTDDISKHFKALIRRLGLPEHTRFHDIRHTHATILAELGEHPKKMQIRMGHATSAFTMDKYTHDTAKMQEGIAEKLSALWSQKSVNN